MTRWRTLLDQKHELKVRVWNREGRRCFYCDRSLRYCETTLDHIKPECFGGPLTFENTVAACHPCNNERGNLPADIYLILKMTGGVPDTRKPGKR